MSRLFLEKMFRLKLKFEADVERMSEINTFPDDDKSFEIHQIKIQHARENEKIIDALIVEYFNQTQK